MNLDPQNEIPRSPRIGGRPRSTAMLLGIALILTAQVESRGSDHPDFKSAIRPIFQRHCINCHGPDRQRGGFRLDDSNSAFAEADSGLSPVVRGSSDESELFRRVITDDDGERMPPEGVSLTENEIELLRQWIEAGATWPDSDHPAAVATGELKVTEADRDFWSFRPLAEVAVPIARSNGARNAIDRFLDVDFNARRSGGSGAEQSVGHQLRLQRRMYYDVIGLPPGEQAVCSVESDPATFDADALCEELLSSRHFGERWARHWLDVARYADSNGYENDLDRPHAYQYRDFVIRAFNQDLPFDDFVRWQVAGDELDPGNPMAVAATGFLAAGPLNRSAPVAPKEVLEKIRFDELDDVVATTSQAFLGLTLACARCHDHKFDPIPTRDYYRFVAAFASTVRRDSDLRLPHRELDLWIKQSKRELLESKIAALDCTDDERKWLLVGPMNPAESKKAFKKFGEAISFDDRGWRESLPESDRRTLDQLEEAAKLPRANDDGPTDHSWASEKALFVTDRGHDPIPVSVLQRGDAGLPGDPAPVGLLTVLARGRDFQHYRDSIAADALEGSTLHRSAVAAWLTDTEYGAGHLAARVIVNRIWHHYFGIGLVDTPNDFGTQGGRPTHPKLLDWLAAELIRNDWRMKSIHRLILQSNAYRYGLDGQRRRPKRLDSEATRDAILAASDRLNRTMFGPGIRPFVPTGAMATRSGDKWPEEVREGDAHFRRSLYIFVKRSIRFPMMEAFDAPDPTASCGRRVTTTVPVQALVLMNDPSVRGAARDFAESLRRQDMQSDSTVRIESAFRRALGRPPDQRELENATAMVNEGNAADGLTDLCHALFLCNEFVYLE